MTSRASKYRAGISSERSSVGIDISLRGKHRMMLYLGSPESQKDPRYGVLLFDCMYNSCIQRADRLITEAVSHIKLGGDFQACNCQNDERCRHVYIAPNSKATGRNSFSAGFLSGSEPTNTSLMLHELALPPNTPIKEIKSIVITLPSFVEKSNFARDLKNQIGRTAFYRQERLLKRENAKEELERMAKVKARELFELKTRLEANMVSNPGGKSVIVLDNRNGSESHLASPQSPIRSKSSLYLRRAKWLTLSRSFTLK
jgi:hypothetical protein